MMEEYFNTLLQETERRMAAAAAGMEGKETVATCREMVSYLKAKNRELKAYALARPFSGNEEEIRYFKYYKPALTGRLLYYYRVYQIESGCPGCLRVAETYYRRAMERAERMMERYLPFYQYYHSGATYRDDYYFLRAKGELSPESGSFVLDEEAEFSTGYDILAVRKPCRGRNTAGRTRKSPPYSLFTASMPPEAWTTATPRSASWLRCSRRPSMWIWVTCTMLSAGCGDSRTRRRSWTR